MNKMYQTLQLEKQPQAVNRQVTKGNLDASLVTLVIIDIHGLNTLKYLSLLCDEKKSIKYSNP